MRVYVAAEVAAITGLKIGTVWAALRSGRLPAKKLGRLYIISESDLDRYKAQDHKPGRPRKHKRRTG